MRDFGHTISSQRGQALLDQFTARGCVKKPLPVMITGGEVGITIVEYPECRQCLIIPLEAKDD